MSNANILDTDECNDCPPARLPILQEAVELGASEAVLLQLRDAARVSRKGTLTVPAHRYEGLSRGKGWARKGRGDKAVWGERVQGGYRVTAGHWVIGGSDGFSRKGEIEWDVVAVAVGPETWLIGS